MTTTQETAASDFAMDSQSQNVGTFVRNYASRVKGGEPPLGPAVDEQFLESFRRNLRFGFAELLREAF